MDALFVVIGVMLFLWSAAVIATALAFLVTHGRLERREWRLFVTASAILAGLIVAHSQLEDKPEQDSSTPMDQAAPMRP